MRFTNWGAKGVVGLMAVAMLALAMGASSAAEKAPGFTLEDQDGKKVSLSDYAGKVVVLEWFNNQCPYVVRHYKSDRSTMINLANKYKGQDVVWLAINSTKSATKASNKEAAGNWNVPYAVLDDHEGAAAKAYNAKTTPHMFVIDKAGNIAYQGAIDDDPSGDKGAAAKNYVAQALDEVLAGKDVSTPKTKPYGCGVKH